LSTQGADVVNKWEELYKDEICNVNYPYDDIVSFLHSNSSMVKNELVLDLGSGLGNNFYPILSLGGALHWLRWLQDSSQKKLEKIPRSQGLSGRFWKRVAG